MSVRGAVKRFLIGCSGARADLLARCPNDEANYVGLGGAVLTTAVFAAVSSAAALGMALAAPVWQVVPLGSLWGLAILNLDRWLVSTQTAGGVLQKLGGLLPRMLLAVLMGVMISEPLVLAIFDAEIGAQLEVLRTGDTASTRAELERRAAPELARLDAAIAACEQALRDREATVERLRQAAFDEVAGAAGTERQGIGPVYEAKRQELEREQARLDGDRAVAPAELATLRADRDAVRSAVERQVVEADRANAANTGLLQRARALDDLRAGDPLVAAFVWILRLVILTVDVLPVLVKFLQSLGERRPYELLADAEQRAYQDAELAIVAAGARLHRDQELHRLRKAHGLPEPVVVIPAGAAPPAGIAGPAGAAPPAPRPDREQLELRVALSRPRKDIPAAPRRRLRRYDLLR